MVIYHGRGGTVVCPQCAFSWCEIHKAVDYLAHKLRWPKRSGTCSRAEVPKDPFSRVVLNCFKGLDKVSLIGVPNDGGIYIYI